MSNVSTLKPAWKKGQSGNPAGTNIPREAWQQLLKARAMAAENAVKYVEHMEWLAFNAVKEETQLAALRELLDRGGMKAVALDIQEVQTDADGNTRTVRVEIVRPNDPPAAS